MKKKLLPLVILLMFFVLFSGCGTQKEDKPVNNNEDQILVPEEKPVGEIEEEPEEEYSDITISAVGDILVHSGVYKAAYNKGSGNYDFSSQFQYVKPILEEADIAVANLETTLSGEEVQYSGYPTFNCPDEIVDALKYSGVDVVLGSNNHRLDKGIKGFFRTIQVVKEKGLDFIGVRANNEEKSYVIKEVKGAKIALINFGYEVDLPDGRRSINGIPIPENLGDLMDLVEYSRMDEGIKRIEGLIEEAREEGAQGIVLFMHWGNEYERQPNEYQKKMARTLSDMGVDLIIGGHPHVLQPAEYISGNNGDTLVFYSLGNFLSAQRKESINNIYSEQGMIASATLRLYKDGRNEILYGSYIPTWVNYKRTPSPLYEVIPAEEALISREKFSNLLDSDMERVKYCKDSVDSLMGTMNTEAVFNNK